MPPMNGMMQMYIASGFADDCDELIHRCAQIETLSYHAFCNIWKDMNFAGVFKGRHSGAEVAELSEEFIHIAKSYMLADNANFEETVAGIFLVYALLNLQPYSKFAALRIIPDDVPIITRIESTARKENRIEVLYILGSILIKGPCQMHVAQREHGMEMPLKKYLGGWYEAEGRGARSRGVLRRQGAELSLARELVALTARYRRAKLAINVKGKMDTDMNYTSDKVPEELYNSLKKVISGNVDNEEETETPSGHHNLVQEIKRRAMSGAVGVTKHTDSVKERKTKTIKKTNSEIKFSKGKIKTGSPTKTIPTSSSKRRRKTSNKGETKTKRTKRKFKYIESDSENDSELELPSSDGDSGDDLNDLETEHDSNDETDRVMDRNKEIDVAMTQNEGENTANENINVVIDHNIDIESLPFIFGTPDESSNIIIISDVNAKDNKNDGDNTNKNRQIQDKEIEKEDKDSNTQKESPMKSTGRKKSKVNESLDLENSLPFIFSTPDESSNIIIISDVNAKDNKNDRDNENKNKQIQNKEIEKEDSSTEKESPKKSTGRKKSKVNESLDLVKSHTKQETPTRVTRSRQQSSGTDKSLGIIDIMDMDIIISDADAKDNQNDGDNEDKNKQIQDKEIEDKDSNTEKESQKKSTGRKRSKVNESLDLEKSDTRQENNTEKESPKKSTGRKKSKVNESLDLDKSDTKQETPTRVTRSRQRSSGTDKSLGIIENMHIPAVTTDDIKTKNTLKRPGKREIKKQLMKSKFKRLGMLSIANFKEENEPNHE